MSLVEKNEKSFSDEPIIQPEQQFRNRSDFYAAYFEQFKATPLSWSRVKRVARFSNSLNLFTALLI